MTFPSQKATEAKKPWPDRSHKATHAKKPWLARSQKATQAKKPQIWKAKKQRMPQSNKYLEAKKPRKLKSQSQKATVREFSFFFWARFGWEKKKLTFSREKTIIYADWQMNATSGY